MGGRSPPTIRGRRWWSGPMRSSTRARRPRCSGSCWWTARPCSAGTCGGRSTRLRARAARGGAAARDGRRTADAAAGRALAHVLLGALDEAAMVVARADDPAAARAEMGQTVRRLLEGLRGPDLRRARAAPAQGRARRARRSGSPRTPGSPVSWREPGATPASARSSRTRRCASPPSSTTSGWPAWDLTPTLNPETGPPPLIHRDAARTAPRLWTRGPRRLLRQSRYAALLASMHGVRLYERRDLDRLSAADADAVRAFLHEQREFQERLLASLRADPATAAAADPERGRPQQPADLDLGLPVAGAVPRLGAAAAPTTSRRPTGPVELAAHRRATGRALLDPWPFADAAVTVRCEGQRLSRTGSRAMQALQEALAGAPMGDGRSSCPEPAQARRSRRGRPTARTARRTPRPPPRSPAPADRRCAAARRASGTRGRRPAADRAAPGPVSASVCTVQLPIPRIARSRRQPRSWSAVVEVDAARGDLPGGPHERHRPRPARGPATASSAGA